MNVEIRHADIHLIDLRTRFPFRYGIATMTEAPHAFVRLRVAVDGRETTGIAADLLPPKWFTKVAEKPIEDEFDEMLTVIEHAAEEAVGLRGESAFDLWRQLAAVQDNWGREQNLPPLLSNFGTTLVERAVIEAVCKALGRSFGDVLRADGLGIRLGEFDSRLEGHAPADLLPQQPLQSVVARHTVGMADPLTEEEIPDDARLDDGLPQSLAASIESYGLRHFKIKVCGDIGSDRERVEQVAAVIAERAPADFAFSLDGNEQFRSLDDFRAFWESIAESSGLEGFFTHLLFVEQPFHRDVALDAEILSDLRAWRERPPLIIDESDASLDSLARALELGYHGTSHKNCKGVMKGIANACLLEKLRRDDPQATCVMSGEDLANIGPVALLQDLAVAASLGIASVERNGHHYFAGLSAFPEAVGQQILAAHSDLYRRTDSGWPAVTIRDGRLTLDSVVRAPFGVGFELDVEQFTPADRWRSEHGC